MENPCSARVTLRQILAADLLANVDRSGLAAGISAAIYEPSFSTVLYYRLAAKLYASGFRRVGKLAWRIHVALTGCHIHIEAKIGPGLKLPHPTGVTVGVGAELQQNVTLYQNVTIGSGFRDRRYPCIQSGCIIFPNAVIVGGVVIGMNAIVGANALVLSDIPPNAIVTGNPARVIATARTKTDPPE